MPKTIQISKIFGVPYFIDTTAPKDHVPIHPDMLYKLISDTSHDCVLDIYKMEVEVE